jgi:hypothetical protein
MREMLVAILAEYPKAQRAEIDGLCTYAGITPTREQVEEYATYTSRGVGETLAITRNPLFVAKRMFTIDVENWRRDLKTGLILPWELLEEAEHQSEFVQQTIRLVLSQTLNARLTAYKRLWRGEWLLHAI